MGQGVGELNVGVTARTTKARKNINNFRKDVRGIRADTGVASRGVGALSARLGVLGAAVAGTAAIVRLGIQGIDQVDSLTKTADKLGVATERLAGLRLAAKTSGVEARTLDTGLQRLVRRVSEAAQGTGEAQGAIEELGLSAEQLNLEAPDEQLRQIAESMSKLPSQAERVRLAFKLFDSEGVALVNTLKEGRKGLDEAQEAAERLGIAIDRETAIKAEKAKQEFDLLAAATDGLKREIGLGLAPSLRHGAKFLADMIKASRTLGGILSDEASATDLAAQAAREKAAADDRAAAAVAQRKKGEEKLTAEFEKQLRAIIRQQQVSEHGENAVQGREDREQFGFARGIQLQEAREGIADAKERADQEQRLLEIKQRIADINKTQLQREREAELRKSSGPMRDEVNDLFDQLERAEAAKRKAEEDAREHQRREAELQREQRRERERQRQDTKRNMDIVFEDRLQRANRGNAELLNARSAGGFSALRASVNQTDRQSLMLQVAKEQREEQRRAGDLLDEIAENTSEKPTVFSFN